MLRVSEELKQKLGRDPTPAEIAGPAELKAKTVEMLLALNVAEVRLDAPVGEGEDSQLIDRFLVDESTSRKSVDATILKEHVAAALCSPSARGTRGCCGCTTACRESPSTRSSRSGSCSA